MTGPVRIAHFSDTHLGYRATSKLDPESNRNQRTVDVDRAFAVVIGDILDRQVDGVLLSGDVFHHARPTWQSLRHFIRQMRRLEDARIPTLVIAGNHDTPRIRTGGSAYSVLELALSHTRFVCDYEDIHIVDTFEPFGIHVQAIPHGALTNPDPVITQVMPGKRNVLVTHGLVPGVLPAGLVAEPGELMLDRNILDDGFDYIALGHIHQAQQVQANAWYAGSTERFGWNDLPAIPGYNLVEFDAPGTIPVVTHVETPARPMVRLKPVYSDGKQAREIADTVLEQLAALDNLEAMTRVELRNVDRPTRREAQSLLKREAGKLVWVLEVAPERSDFTVDGVGPQLDDSTLDLHALFAEFVASRKSTYPGEDFATQLLERGNRALTDAILAEENPTPEDDAIS